MPNYYRKDIAAFVANKTSEDSRMTPRRTPKKNVTLSSQYLFEYPGETNRCRKFLYGHYIKNFENEMRVRLRQHEFDESPKLTLANDSVEDQVLAKHTLIRHFATVDGKEGLQVIKTNPPTSNSKTRNLTFVIKQTLSLIYDVGSKFIDDASGVSWDLDSFRMVALAYASVFGEGTIEGIYSYVNFFSYYAHLHFVVIVQEGDAKPWRTTKLFSRDMTKF